MTVHLIASCTERKRVSVPTDLRLGGVRKEGVDAWLARLASSDAEAVPARDLYGGEHWQLILELERRLVEKHGDVSLWVASAGHGLVGADDRIKPYAATFASGSDDTVPGEAAAWWSSLCAARGSAVTGLADAGAEAIVVVASTRYLRAMAGDLEQAGSTMEQGALILFSGSGPPDSLHAAAIEVDARVQVALSDSERLRGTKQGLAARAALTLLSRATWPPRAEPLQAAYTRLVTDHERPAVPQRERHDDQAVLDFIATELREDSRLGWTPLLRKWRASGHACEQKRFRELFRSVKDRG